MKKVVIALLVVIAAAAGGWVWWSKRSVTSSDELTLFGNVDIRQIALAFDGTGRILDLKVDEGDSVKAGEVIGHLDVRTLELQAKQAAAQVEVQKQTLLKLRNGSRPEEIEQSNAQLASAEAISERADRDFERSSHLQSIGSAAVSEQAFDQARAEAHTAKARVREMQASLKLRQIGNREEDIAVAEAQMNATEANLALLRHQIEQGQLKVPTDAVIRSRLLEPGDMANPQRPAFSLALTKPKWVRVYANEIALGKIRPGLEARVFTDSRPTQPVIGRISFISSVAEFTPKSVQTEDLRTSLVYEVRVLVDDDADVLRLGQPVTVRISLGRSP